MTIPDSLISFGNRPVRGASWLAGARRCRRPVFVRLVFEKLESRTLLAGDLELSPVESDAVITTDADTEVALTTADIGSWSFDLPSEVEGPVVDLILTATNPDGSPLSGLAVGQDFVLHVAAADLRDVPLGVFAAYFDIAWDSSLAVVTGSMSYGDTFPTARWGDASAGGLIDEAGAVGDITQPGGGAFEVLRVPMRASAPGTLVLAADPTERLPATDVLVHGWNAPVPQSWVRYGSVSLVVDGTSNGSGGAITTSGPADGDLDGQAVDVTLRITNPDGSPVSSLVPGQAFVLQVYAADVREAARGVFALFVDLRWDSALAAVAGPVQFGADYPNVHRGDGTGAGLLDEVGAVGDLRELGAGPHLVLSIPMQALGSGVLVITSDPADMSPASDVLVYGWNAAVPAAAVSYGSVSVVIGDAASAPAGGDSPDGVVATFSSDDLSLLSDSSTSSPTSAAEDDLLMLLLADGAEEGGTSTIGGSDAGQSSSYDRYAISASLSSSTEPILGSDGTDDAMSSQSGDSDEADLLAADDTGLAPILPDDGL